MDHFIRMLTLLPGFGGGGSNPAPPPVPPPPPPPPPVPTSVPKPPTPVDSAVVEAKKAARKDAQRKFANTSAIKTGPSGLLDEDADTTKKSLIG